MNIQEQIKIPWSGWYIVRRIGQGSFGKVYEIERNLYGTVEKAAMKVISVPENNEVIDDLYGSGYDDESVRTWCSKNIESIVNEYNVMSRLKGKTNIVSCEDIFVAPHDSDPGADIFIRMELLTSLSKLLSLIQKNEGMLSAADKETLHRLRPERKEFTEEDVVKLGNDILQALEICEKNNIVHRDIKPENILISDDGDYKLGDFGIARKMEHTTVATIAGTGKYMAPEVIKGGMTGKDVDTYALGLVMYRLLNRGRLPFYPLNGFASAEQVEEAQRRRLAGEPFDPPVDGSPELKAIVMKACSYDRNDRFSSASEMAEKLAEAEEIRMERMRNRIPDPPVQYYRVNEVQGDNDATFVEDEEKTVSESRPDEDATYTEPVTISEKQGKDTGIHQNSLRFQQRSSDKKKSKNLLIAVICTVLVLCLGLMGFLSSKGGSTVDNGSKGSKTVADGSTGRDDEFPDETFTSVTQKYSQTKDIYDRWPDTYNPAAEEDYIGRVNQYSSYERDEQGHPITDNGLVFLKYAIADFDGDGLNEWAVCRYDFSQDEENKEHPSVEMDLYYYNGSSYSPYHGTRFQGRNFDPDNITIYNNMVWLEESDKDGKHYTCVHFLDWFEDEAREELISYYCPEYQDELLFIDDGSGTIIREEVSSSAGFEWEDTMTKMTESEFEAEINEITRDAEIIHPEFKEFIPE